MGVTGGDFVHAACGMAGFCVLLVSGLVGPSSGAGGHCSSGIKRRQHCTTWKMELGRRLGDDATLKVLPFKIRARSHSLPLPAPHLHNNTHETCQIRRFNESDFLLKPGHVTYNGIKITPAFISK